MSSQRGFSRSSARKAEALTPTRNSRQETGEKRGRIDRTRRSQQRSERAIGSRQRGSRVHNQMVRTLLRDENRLKQAGIEGNPRQKEQKLRRLFFSRDIDLLDSRERRLVRGIARSHGVSPRLLAGIRRLEVDGIGHAYTHMTTVDKKKHVFELESAATQIKGRQRQIRQVLKSDAPDDTKRKQIEQIFSQPGSGGLLAGVEDLFESTVTPALQTLRGQYLPRDRACQMVSQEFRKNPDNAGTYGYSRSTPPRGSVSGTPSYVSSTEDIDFTSLDTPGEGGKQVVNVVNRALQEGSIRGKHCWDWCEQVYQQAGVKRKNLYSNFKTPRGDTRTGFTSQAQLDSQMGGLQPGDWLFVKNHNRADTHGNHSVIFLGWEGNKVKTANCPRSGHTGHISSYDVSQCPIVWISRPVR